MARNRSRTTNRRDHGSYAAWPHECAKHANFLRLSPHAKALLLYFIGQYRGSNNGDLDCAWGHVKNANLGSPNTVEKARGELEAVGWIVRTRQGSVNRCCLYALTFRGINECNGKLDEPASAIPLAYWKEGRNPWLERQQPTRPKRSGIFSKRTTCGTLPHDVRNPTSPIGDQSPTYLTSCACPPVSEAGPTSPVEVLSTVYQRSEAKRARVPDASGGVKPRTARSRDG